MEHKNEENFGLHLCLSIVKIALKAAAVAAAFCIVKEVHKVHKAIEEHHK